jgi:hypothetical protein
VGARDRRPAACRAASSASRRSTETALDAPESQLNARDWFLSYPVEILVDLENPRRNSAKVAEIVEAFIKAIDTDTLTAQDGSILVARVVNGAPVEYVDKARPMLGYVVNVEIHKLV